MLFQELPLPFPIYDKIEKQARFLANTDEPCGSSLLCPKDAFLPFQIRKAAASELPRTVELFDHEDSLVADVTADMVPQITGRTFGGFDYLTYLGNLQVMVAGVPLDMATGQYYLKFTFWDGEELWSEVFRVPLERFTITDPTTCPFLKMEWSNDADVEPIYYSFAPEDRLVCRLYLDTIINNSEPEIEQEGTKNGDNVLIPDFQKVTVRYVIQAHLPDFVKLALSVMPIHKTVNITTENGLRTGVMLRPEFESKADDNGYFSDVTIKFEQDIAIIKRGCGDNMVGDPCPDMPLDADLDVTAIQAVDGDGKGGLLLTMALPGSTYADIFTAYSDFTSPHFSVGKVYQAQLAAGFFIPYSKLFGGVIVIYIRTFNCTVGTTGSFYVAPPFSYHPRALAFFEAIEQDPGFIGSGGNISPTERNAVNNLVVSLIDDYGIWDDLEGIYPFIAGNPDAFKFNLKDARDADAAFRLTFPNGMLPSSLGMGVSGVNQYARSFWNPQALRPGSPSMMMGGWVNATLPMSKAIAAADDGANRFGMRFNGNDFRGDAFDGLAPFVSTIGAGGFAKFLSFSMRGFPNGSLYLDGAPVFNFLPTTLHPTVGGVPPNAEVNIGGDVSTGSFMLGTFSIFFLGLGLNDTKMANLYSSVVAFNSTLGR